MNLEFNEEQNIIRNTAKEFLKKESPSSLIREMREDDKGYTDELWGKMADLGWMGVIIPEEYEGYGGSFMDLTIIMESMGEANTPSPYFSTVVLGAQAILLGGSEDQKKELLPKVTLGELILALALIEPGSWFGHENINATATKDGDSYVISGTKLFVENAHVADKIICAANAGDSGLTLFLVDRETSGLEITTLSTFGYDKQCEVIFNNVRVPEANVLGEVGAATKVLDSIEERAAVTKCAEMLGASRVAFTMAVQYAKEREQFGRPIGSFQAIQHFCANMAVDVDSIRYATYRAAWKISEGEPAGMEAAMAKAWASEAATRVTRFSHQIHGAVSFCDEHDLHLFYRKTKAASVAFGDSEYYYEKVAQSLGL